MAKPAITKDMLPHLHRLGTDEYVKFLQKPQPVTGLAARILMFPGFETAMATIILFNMVIMIVDIDRSADEDHTGNNATYWTDIVGWVVLVVFVMEMILRIMTYRITFFHDTWNVFDFIIVITDLSFSFLGLVLGNVFPVSILRIFRLAKLARASKILRVFPELRLLLAGLLSSMSAIFWGTLLLSFFILVWSMMAVLFIHPLNKDLEYDGCDRCNRAYSTVLQSSLTFWQQIVTGDSWGAATIPLIENHPATAIFFIAVFLSVGMAVMNLILGVVVSVAEQAKDDLLQDEKSEKALRKLHTQGRLLEMCRQMDKDGSGELSIDEIVMGFDSEGEFRDNMLTLNITKQDLSIAWGIIDTDGSGSLSYKEFVTQLCTMRSSDVEFMLAYIKYYIHEISQSFDEKLSRIQTDTTILKREITNEFHSAQSTKASEGMVAATGKCDNGHVGMSPTNGDKNETGHHSQGPLHIASAKLGDERLDLLTQACNDIVRMQSEFKGIMSQVNLQMNQLVLHDGLIQHDSKKTADTPVFSAFLPACCKLSAPSDRHVLFAPQGDPAKLQQEDGGPSRVPRGTPSIANS